MDLEKSVVRKENECSESFLHGRIIITDGRETGDAQKLSEVNK